MKFWFFVNSWGEKLQKLIRTMLNGVVKSTTSFFNSIFVKIYKIRYNKRAKLDLTFKL